MGKTFLKSITVIVVMAVTCSCGKNSATKTSESGKELRIISLVPSVTDELVSLGVGDRIVGATSYCSITRTNRDLIIGNATDVNIEKIILLKPDIVFASGLTQQSTLNTLKNNGINVYMTPKMKSFEVICNHTLKLGELTGTKEQAEKLVSKSKQVVDSLKSLIPYQPHKLKMFFQIGTNPLFTVIPDTYMNDFITFAGCENFAGDLTGGTITRESVLQRNPDIIFIVTMGIAAGEEKKTWESYPELNAAKTNRIFIIDADIASTPTVITFTKTLEQVVKKVYF